MKKSLLFLTSMLVMSVTASAQSFTAEWKQLVPESKAFVAEDTCYLWNVGDGGFYTNYRYGSNGGPYYKTRASVNKTVGSKLIFTRTNPGSTEEKNLEDWSADGVLDNTYLLVSYVDAPSRNITEYRCSFCGGFNDVWTDNNTRGDRYFNVVKGTGNYIKIERNALLDGVQEGASSEGKYLGVLDSDADRVLYLHDTEARQREKADAEEEGEMETYYNIDPSAVFYEEWAVVSKDAYKAWVEAGGPEKAEACMAAQSLKAALEKAYEDNPGINLDAQLAVYNNTSKSAEELKAAENSISASVIAFMKDKATVDSPVNFTSAIVNPTFDTIGDFTGWTPPTTDKDNKGFGAAGETFTNAEVYGRSFDIYQDIKDLPAGVYKVICKGYTRYKNAQDDYNAWTAGQVSETKIYLKSDTYGQFFTPVMHVSEGGSYTSFGVNQTEVTTDKGTLYCPNSMKAADSFFHEKENPDRYQNIAFGGIADGDVLRLGVFNNKATGSDWSIFDDFQLYYLGDQLDAYKLWGQTVKDMNGGISFDGVYYGEPDKKLYDETMEALTAASSKEDFVKAIEQAGTLADVVSTSKENYATYVEAVKAAKVWLTEFSGAGEALDLISDYLQSDEGASEDFPNGAAKFIIDYENGVYGGTLSGEDIAKETAFLADLKSKAISGSLKPGDDCTNLLVNPSFADGFNGWTKKDGSPASGNVGNYSSLTSVKVNNNVEVYNGVVDIYQEVKNVPDGVYTLTCKAFERPAGNGNYDGSEESKVFLFMNDLNPTPVQNICGDALMPNDDESNIQNLKNCYIERNEEMSTVKPAGWDLEDYMVSGQGYVPNGMVGAAIAFSAGRYEQKVYGLVEGGTLRIGLTSNGKSAHWVLWTDFTLTYEGSGADAQAIILSKQLENLNQYLEENESDMTEPAIEAAKGVAETAQKAIDEKNSEAIEKSIAAIPEALDVAKANVAAKQELEAVLPELDAAMEAEEPNPAGMDAYNEIKGELEETQSLTTDQVKALTTKVKEVIALLNTPVGYEDASDENPVDFTQRITNNDFETGDMTGWTYYQGTDSGVRDNSNDTFAVTNDESSYVFNTWSGSLPDEGFWLAQTIIGLPEGTYKLSALLASDKGNTIGLSVNGTVVEFNMENDKTIGQTCEVIFKLEAPTGSKTRKAPATQDVEIKALSKTWFKADDFKLEYYGTESSQTPTGIEGIGAAAQVRKNGKYLENGRIVIIRNGMKYNVAGQAIK